MKTQKKIFLVLFGFLLAALVHLIKYESTTPLEFEGKISAISEDSNWVIAEEPDEEPSDHEWVIIEETPE